MASQGAFTASLIHPPAEVSYLEVDAGTSQTSPQISAVSFIDLKQLPFAGMSYEFVGAPSDFLIETRSLPALTRSSPGHFTFYVAPPIRSIHHSSLYASLVRDFIQTNRT